MFDIASFRVEKGAKLDLSKIDPSYTGGYKSKEEALKHTEDNIQKMIELQNVLYAQDRYALLIVFQAMDAAGKDGAIKHVMSGLNPQATMVYSFKQPSREDLDHDYLWRYNKCLPERGRIGIFNRSYYEEVLVVRVHNLLKEEKLPEEFINKGIWKQRLGEICNYEKYLIANGINIIKFYLHISREEQKKRLLERIDDQSKNWKYSIDDIREREYWKDYIKVYKKTIEATSTSAAPWYVVPSDTKWFARLAISEVIVHTLKKMKLEYPKMSKEQLETLAANRNKLLAEE